MKVKHFCECGREYNLTLALEPKSDHGENLARRAAAATARSARRGQSSPISDSQVVEIRELYWQKNMQQGDIADRFGAGLSTIQKIVSGRSRLYAGGPTSATSQTPQALQALQAPPRSSTLQAVPTRATDPENDSENNPPAKTKSRLPWMQ